MDSREQLPYIVRHFRLGSLSGLEKLEKAKPPTTPEVGPRAFSIAFAWEISFSPLDQRLQRMGKQRYLICQTRLQDLG